jgi:parvulin-like peptidyl-prolyl isomerase
MRISKTPVTLLFMAAGLVLLVSCAKKNPAVATIGRSDKILLEDFKTSFRTGKSDDYLRTVGLEELKANLNRMVDGRIKVLAGYEMGLDKDSAVVSRIKPVKESLLLRRLFDLEIVDPTIKESDVRDFYAKTGKEVVIRDMVFKVPPRSKPEVEQAMKDSATDVLRRIRAGEDFAGLARQFSDEQDQTMKGGRTATLNYTRTKDPIQKAVFSMRSGEVSEVIRAPEAFHIIKVEEIRNKEQKPYAQARPEILRALRMEYQKEIRDKATAYQNNLTADHKVQYGDSALVFLADKIKSYGNPMRDAIYDSLGKLTDSEKSKVLAQYGQKQMTAAQFRDRLMTIRMNSPLQMGGKDEIKKAVENWLMFDFLLERAQKKGLEKDKVVTKGIKTEVEREMSNLLLQKNVYDQIQPTDEEILNYYDTNKEKVYSDPEKVKIQEVLVKDKNLADQIYSWAKSGRNFTQLARKYTERVGYQKKDGILDYFTKGRWGNLGEKAFELRVGQIAGPVPLANNQGYSVIKMLDRKPMKLKPFDEIKERVKRDLTIELRRNKEAEWVAAKRSEIGVVIDEKVLEGAFKEKAAPKPNP